MKILFLSRWYPFPADNGSKIRIINLIKQLSRNHQVDLVSFVSEALSVNRIEGMKPYCSQITTVPYRPFRPNSLKSLLGYFSPKPRSVVDTFSPEYRDRVIALTHQNNYDALIADEIDTVPYAIKPTGMLKIFEDLELIIPYESFRGSNKPVQKARHWLTWWKLLNYLKHTMSSFDGCTVVSDKDRQLANDLFQGEKPVELIPNGVDLSRYAGEFGEPEEDTLIYSGALSYFPNFEAVEYFLQDIFPLIRAQRPDVRLFITGKNDGVRIDRLPHAEGVTFTGYVDDIRPVLARNWVSVVPLRSGGGTRLKILEALALKTPVVSTQKGMEGLDLIPGRDILVANDPQGFADSVIRILEDTQLRKTLGMHGFQVVKEKYDWQRIGQQYNHFIDALVNRSHERNG